MALKMTLLSCALGIAWFASAPVLLAQSEVIEGTASWYGPGFAGRPTANGEVFDPNALTAAHRSLPFGTQVRVTNLRNGESIIVRINDRGPFVGGRIIDLSREAAARIGMVNRGVARVRVEVLSADAAPATPAAPTPVAAAPTPLAAPAAPPIPSLIAARAEDLQTYDIISTAHRPGDLLLLRSAVSSEPVMVRVVSSDLPEHVQADVLLSSEMYAMLGGSVFVLSQTN